MVQRRRLFFWDLYVADIWQVFASALFKEKSAEFHQSLHTGRPPSFDLAYIDCKMPQTGTDSGEASDCASVIWVFHHVLCVLIALSVGAWQYRFASECVAKVIACTLAAESPSYSDIMDLDAIIRKFPCPTIDTGNKATSSWQRFILDHIRETRTCDSITKPCMH